MTPRPQPSEGERRPVRLPSITDRATIAALRAHNHRTVAELDAERRA